VISGVGKTKLKAASPNEMTLVTEPDVDKDGLPALGDPGGPDGIAGDDVAGV
jgi:hypothetical protein